MLINFKPFLLMLTLSLAACGGAEDNNSKVPSQPIAQHTFKPQGLNGLIIDRIYQQQDKILALSDDGLYQQQPNDEWKLLGFKGLQTLDLAFINDQHWLLSLVKANTNGVQEYQVHESFDAGQNWVQVQRPFGENGQTEGIYAMRYDELSQQLFATGINVLAVSKNHGISWQKLAGNWAEFAQPKWALGIDPRSKDVWWGGQGPIEDGVLNVYRTELKQNESFNDLIPNPAAYTNVRFAASTAGHSLIYACGEDGILLSSDLGKTWHNLIANADKRFYFDILFDTEHNNRLYTASWTKRFTEGQPLILEWSDNQGASWQKQTYETTAEFFGGVRSLTFVRKQNQSYLYLGLWKGGVMQVTINR